MYADLRELTRTSFAMDLPQAMQERVKRRCFFAMMREIIRRRAAVYFIRQMSCFLSHKQFRLCFCQTQNLLGSQTNRSSAKLNLYGNLTQNVFGTILLRGAQLLPKPPTLRKDAWLFQQSLTFFRILVDYRLANSG